MAWRIVVQPNGLYARFSDIVDDFTHSNMTRDEAVELCREALGGLDAEKKVASGESAGSVRYMDEIKTVRLIHGDSLAEERLREHSVDK